MRHDLPRDADVLVVGGGSDSALRQLMARHVDSLPHVVGTCAMGSAPRMEPLSTRPGMCTASRG